MRSRAIVGANVGPVKEAAVPLSGAAVTFTKFAPQYITTCCAASEYVLLKGCVELSAKVEKMAISSCRHELHVVFAAPDRLTPRGR